MKPERCSQRLREEGKAHARACAVCGFGPCLGDADPERRVPTVSIDPEVFEQGMRKEAFSFLMSVTLLPERDAEDAAARIASAAKHRLLFMAAKARAAGL